MGMGGRAFPCAGTTGESNSANLLLIQHSSIPQPRNPHDDKLVLSKHASIYPLEAEVRNPCLGRAQSLTPLFLTAQSGRVGRR